ncbi:MAG TPA: lactate racemase domain-containing protein [Thermogutta sp.]|nr:lactate racemase domain-containing protein [Thermogutta sp.]
MPDWTFPSIFRLRQKFPSHRIDDIPARIVAEFERANVRNRVRPGQTVAITAGSRGIANIVLILRTVVEIRHQWGARPFIVPAMGSHGGGMVEGQRGVLHTYGITEDSVGCPIRATMDTVVVGRAPEGFDVHFDRFAYEADHVVVVNRIKPHTLFVGPIESGLMKMLLIGLGKHRGAEIYHRAAWDYSFDRIVRDVGRIVLSRCRILLGLAIVEDAYDATAHLEAVLPEAFETREPELLRLAKEWMPRLPFDHAHVLLIDQLGKDLSGSGIDTNIIGRKFNDHRAAPGEKPDIRFICVRGLSPGTHGNAIGLGLAEFCRSDILPQIDVHATRINAITSGHVSAAMVPLDYPTDREMLGQALANIGMTPPEHARLMWIADTLHLTEVECSAAYLAEAKARDDLEILTGVRPMPFGDDGNLPDMMTLRASS